MKSQIKKIVSIFVCICLAVTGLVITASAADSATITFNDVAKRTELDANHQVWVENGITVTNNKGASTTNVADYSNPARFYKGSDLTIAYTSNFTALEVKVNNFKPEYVTCLVDVIDPATATVTTSGTVVTIVPTTATNSFSCSFTEGQVRVDSITVYTGTVPSGGATPPPQSNDPAADSTLTIEQAIALGASKEHNVYTSGKYYVEGVITEVYNTQYGNMKIKDANDNILTIYGTWSADGNTRYDALDEKPIAGDTVKLYGIIGQYNDVPQLKNGWIVEHTASGIVPPPVVNNDPAADSVLTIEEALELGASKEHNVYTENKYYVTGEITEIYNEMYGNMKIKDANDNILTVYGTWNEDGTIRFDELTDKPVVGDTVTVYGIIGQYNGTPQVKNGWFKDAPAVEDDDDNTDNTPDGTPGGTTGGATDNDTGANTDNDNSATSPETGDSFAVFAVMALVAAAAVVLVSKKVRA